jgi:hypothetical protein
MIRARNKVFIWAGLAVASFGLLDWADEANRPRPTMARNPDRTQALRWDLRLDPAAPAAAADVGSPPSTPQLPCDPGSAAGQNPAHVPEAATAVDPYAG